MGSVYLIRRDDFVAFATKSLRTAPDLLRRPKAFLFPYLLSILLISYLFSSADRLQHREAFEMLWDRLQKESIDVLRKFPKLLRAQKKGIELLQRAV